jgi:riboflavin biosynthesis pyrimidine reductase
MASFVRKDLVDEAHVFVAPILIGGSNARHAVGGPDLVRLADARRFELLSITPSGPDAHLHFRRR